MPDAIRQKLDKKAEQMRFVGYSGQPKGYRLLNEKTGKVIKYTMWYHANFGKYVEPNIVGSVDTVVVEGTREELDKVSQSESARQGPTMQTRPPTKYGVDEYVDTASCTLDDHAHHVTYNVSQIKEPVTMEEAMASKYSAQWKQAADSEYESLISNETW